MHWVQQWQLWPQYTGTLQGGYGTQQGTGTRLAPRQWLARRRVSILGRGDVEWTRWQTRCIPRTYPACATARLTS